MKATRNEQISRDLNSPPRTTRVDFAAATTTSETSTGVRVPSTRIRSQRPTGNNTNNTELSVQTTSGNSEIDSRPASQSHELEARAISNENATANYDNEMYGHFDKGNGPSMIAPNRNYPPTHHFINSSEEWKDEERAEVASTASSFLQAAAIPPRLVTQETTPGAVCVPGLVGSYDDDQHDNLIDMEDENDGDYTNNNSSGIISRYSSSMRGTSLQSPESTSLTFYSQSASLSTPIVAELAPSHSLSEREVEDRLAERLEAQMEAQITERLQREVDRRFSMDKRQHVVAEVISGSDDGIGTDSPKVEKKEEENFKICGIRRTWWGMIICIIMLLTTAGIGGTYLWYSRAREIIVNDAENLTPQAAYTDTPTQSPTTLFPSAGKISAAPEAPEIGNTTAMPSPSPQETTEPTQTLPAPLSTEQRREFLITNMGSYVIPDYFKGIPATYFDGNTFQRAALDWMVNVDLETDIFDTPIQSLVERYVLAVLYYSTGGPETWTESYSFLSSRNICQWNNDHEIATDIIGSDATTETNPDASGERSEYTAVKKGVFCEDGSLFVTSIGIPENSLQGEVPWELSLLEYLSQINFDSNSFQGPLPTELGRLSRLEALWFKNNDLTGRLPSEFSNATELASIDIEGNSISSVLPPEWGSLSNLFYLSLRQNDITGSLPSDWRKLNRLKTLDLEGNQLRGVIPAEYGELTALVSLYLESNQLGGLLPSSFGKLTNLVHYFVDDNIFSGTVPTEYSNLVNLEYFWFNGNSLTGSVDLTLCNSLLRPSGANLRSNCLGNDLAGGRAQIQCSCCTTCCDSNGVNCEDNPLL